MKATGRVQDEYECTADAARLAIDAIEKEETTSGVESEDLGAAKGARKTKKENSKKEKDKKEKDQKQKGKNGKGDREKQKKDKVQKRKHAGSDAPDDQHGAASDLD